MSEYHGEDWYPKLCDRAVALAKKEDVVIREYKAILRELLDKYMACISTILGVDKKSLEQQLSDGGIKNIICIKDPKLTEDLNEASLELQVDETLRTVRYRTELEELNAEMQEVDKELKENNRPTIFS